MRMQLLLFFFFLFFFVCAVAGAGASSPEELRALLEFKKGIVADPLRKVYDSWNVSSSDPASICPQFYGISCDDNGFVSSIVLDRLDLAGEIKFVTLYNLKNLRNLSLSGNRLTGRIVPTLGSMYSLQYLDLSSNQFYGPIPARINDLYGLNYLNLSNNNFTGGFPNGIQNLQQLAILDLHSNSLWGDLGVLFSELRNVQYVDLSDNAFYGSLSMDSGDIPSVVNTVQHVNLSGNRLGGGFFNGDALVLFRNLHVLDLSDNELNGKLPSFGSLPNLQVLRLSNAQLFGPIPEELLQNMIPLKELDLSRNGFSGSIPKINSTSLTTLNLSSNELSGSLPPSLGSCQIVDLSNNLLSDDISVFQKWESPLQVLDLSSNKLSGNLPNLTMYFKGLISLNLGNNSLKGSVPPILMPSPSLVFLDLRRNELDGPLPPGLFTSMSLNHLDISNNRFTGPIPLHGSQEKSLIELSPYPPMEFLDLSYNMLTGTLSSDIGNFRRLRLLNLANDGLSGELPNELSKLGQLEFLDLSGNHFKGNIPEKLSPELKFLNMSGNGLSGKIPENLKNFSSASFYPGNPSLTLPDGGRPTVSGGGGFPSPDGGEGHNSKSSIKIAIIVASVVAALMIAFVLLAYYRAQIGDFRVKTAFGGQTSLTGRDIKHGISSRPTTSLSFSNAHLLTSNSRSLSGQSELGGDMVEPPVMPPAYAASSASVIPNLIDTDLTPSGRKSSPGSPMASSPRFVETIEQQVTLDVYSPDRFAGQLFFFDPRPQFSFTAEDLSRAPAEILGRSSHGTLYKATLGGGHMLTVKWLRVGLTKDKKEFAKEIKKLGPMNHPNVVRLLAYYWGPREQERLTLANYIEGDSLALHLYETTPRRYSLLSFNQRLKVAIDVARGLSYLHGRGMPHGNLKPTNIILEGPQYDARLTDFGLHRLMTPAGIAEQILNLGALGYRAPELSNAPKPVPSLKADVYAFGVILMELLTRRSAGDIISGQSGAVDLTDWVRLCDQEGRIMDCIDRDIAGGEQHSKAMDDMLEVSLRCILPLTERPTVRQILEDLCAISV